MRNPLASTRFDGSLGPEERRFMEIAGALLGAIWSRRLRYLPSAVGDAAYDDALDTITRRAFRGVAEFRDERGEASPERVKAYVKFVVDRKLMDIHRVPQVAVFDERQTPRDHDAVIEEDLPDRLARDRYEDGLLAQALSQLDEFERRAHEIDARRTSWIAHLLVEHGVNDRGAEIVMLRAERELMIEVGEHGLVARYLPAVPMRAIAQRLAISDSYARKLASRVMHRLPPVAARLIDDPGEYMRACLDHVETIGTRGVPMGADVASGEVEGAEHRDVAPVDDGPARHFLTELERLIGTRAPDAESLEQAARIVAAEQSWRDGLGVLLVEDDVARLLRIDRDRVAELAAHGEMIVLSRADGHLRFPAFQFQEGRPTPSLARAHRTLVESGYVSPESAASWARTRHPELELRSPAQWAGEHRDDERLLLVARRDAARAAQ